jgi:cephalosporin hydroxylase
MSSHFLKERLNELKFHRSLVAVRQARKLLKDVVPSMQLKWNRSLRERLIAEFQECTTVEQCIDFTKRHMQTGSCQIPFEIKSAIELIGSTRPKVMCEIGTLDGGTSLLFIRLLSTLEVMICIDLHVKNKELLKLLAPPGLQLKFVDMPSYADRTVDKVSRFLNGRSIDALFIDGDHRYEGVKKDFTAYRGFVRNGGQILFHDIVQEKGTSKAWAGGEPKIWKELSPQYAHHEFINDQDQDGFGIGSLTYHAASAATH